MVSLRHQGEVETAKADQAVMQIQLYDAQAAVALLRGQLATAKADYATLQAALKKAEAELAQMKLAHPKG